MDKEVLDELNWYAPDFLTEEKPKEKKKKKHSDKEEDVSKKRKVVLLGPGPSHSQEVSIRAFDKTVKTSELGRRSPYDRGSSHEKDPRKRSHAYLYPEKRSPYLRRVQWDNVPPKKTIKSSSRSESSLSSRHSSSKINKIPSLFDKINYPTKSVASSSRTSHQSKRTEKTSSAVDEQHGAFRRTVPAEEYFDPPSASWKTENKPAKPIDAKPSHEREASSFPPLDSIPLLKEDVVDNSPEPSLSAWAKESKEDDVETQDDRKIIKARLDALAERDRSVRFKEDSTLSGPLRGTCPDMCPERERLMRQLKGLAHSYECRNGVLEPSLAVKEYARSSADQEQPLPHDLRPQPVLSLTMTYLVTQVMPRIDNGTVDSLPDWYDFLWDRLRAVRKDIVQQQLCDLETVTIVEQCARFHIACFDRLSALGAAAFDAKINAENLMHCLKMLLGMYEDLRRAGTLCKNEPEFTAYMILLRLGSGDLLWEFPNFPLDLQQTPPVIEAVHIHTSFNTNAYAHFFRQVARTTYLNAVLMQQFFYQVRVNALYSMAWSYPAPGKVSRVGVNHVARSLRFDTEEEAVAFCKLCGITTCDKVMGELRLSRARFSRPEGPAPQLRSSSLITGKQVPLANAVVGHGVPLPTYIDHQVHSSFVDGTLSEIKKASLDASDQEEKMLRDNIERKLFLKRLKATEIAKESLNKPDLKLVVSPNIDTPDAPSVNLPSMKPPTPLPTPPRTPIAPTTPISLTPAIINVSPVIPKSFNFAPVSFKLDTSVITKAIRDLSEDEIDEAEDDLPSAKDISEDPVSDSLSEDNLSVIDDAPEDEPDEEEPNDEGEHELMEEAALTEEEKEESHHSYDVEDEIEEETDVLSPPHDVEDDESEEIKSISTVETNFEDSLRMQARARWATQKWRTWVRNRRNSRGFAWAGRAMQISEYLVAWGRVAGVGAGAAARASARHKLTALASRVLSGKLGYGTRGAALLKVGQAIFERVKNWPPGAIAYWKFGVPSEFLDHVSCALDSSEGVATWTSPNGQRVLITASSGSNKNVGWSVWVDFKPGDDVVSTLVSSVPLGFPPVVCSCGLLSGLLGALVESWIDTLSEDAQAYDGLRKKLTNGFLVFGLVRGFGVRVAAAIEAAISKENIEIGMSVREAAKMESPLPSSKAACIALKTISIPNVMWPPSSGTALMAILRPLAPAALSAVLRMINPPDDADTITLATHLTTVPWLRIIELILKQRIAENTSSELVLYNSSVMDTSVYSHWWMDLCS